jgi:hypothetical protein
MLVALTVGIRAEDKPANSILVRCYEYDRGNVLVFDTGSSYADTEPVVINAGQQPNAMEYDIDFPIAARYVLWAKYAAADSRPVDIFLDEAKIAQGFKSTTGSWQASTGKWEQQCEVDITAGKHCVKLVCPGPCIPHIIAIRLDSPVPFPAGFKRKPKPIERNLNMAWSGKPEKGRFGFAAYVRPDGFVDAPADYNPMVPFERVPPPTPNAERVLEYLLMAPGKHHVAATVQPVEDGTGWEARLSVKVNDQRTDTAVLPLSAEHVRQMLEHTKRLIGNFRGMGEAGALRAEETQAGKLLRELEGAAAKGDQEKDKWEGVYDLYVRAFLLKNRVALSNPLLKCQRLLFVKRFTYDTSHIYTTYFDGSHRFGGGLYTLSPLRPEASPTRIAGELSDKAIYRDPDLSWDGTRLLFSYKPDPPTPCRLYEVGVDGSGLRQVTSSEYDDIDPCYLPNGRIMFVSTRCRRVVLCHNAFTVSVLYTAKADGSDVRCVSPNTVNEFTPSVLADGRVAYTRWEYVDKHLGNNQSMWVADPDGGRPAHLSGEHWGPITLWEPRQVPGSPLIVCTLAPHMPIAVGPVALVDPTDVCTSPARYENLTPELPAPHHFGWHRTDVGYYGNPFPLSKDYFLVSYAYGPGDREPAGYGLYLLDRWNNRDLIYRDPDISCFEALPVQRRPRPPILAEPSASDDAFGRACVMDVYRGLDGIERGKVKYLRIIEEIPKPVSAECSGYGLQYPVISNYGHLALKRVWGTVPVEPDGSAYFKVPANVGVYFAALDEDFMEVQRMRALTHVLPGQTLACVGCHEPRTTTPPNQPALAVRRPPSEITPPPDGVHAPDFAYDVQPVLNRQCARCHTGEKPAGGLDLSPDPTNLFNVAYENLTTRGYVSYVDARRSDTLPLRRPKYYGSHASRLIEVLRTTHRDRVKLPPEGFRRLVEWIDCNAPYYGTYLFTRKNTVGGEELLTPGIRAALNGVFERKCASCHQKDVARIERISFAHPEQSPALLAPLARAAGGTERCGRAVFPSRDDPDAQALIGALARLQEEMKTNPRMDMRPERPPLLDPQCRYVYRP